MTATSNRAPTRGGSKPRARERPAAAQRLEAYLKQNTKHLKAGHTATGDVISFVEATNGELKIWTFLNADIPSETATAGKVCRVAQASGVPEANGALVVDGGDVELQRC